MPFSMAVFSYIKKIKIVTLQVRILIMKKRLCLYLKCREKKVCRSVSASMTLEASLALSLFVFASVSLILPMRIMTTQRRIQAGLESACEDLSKYGYLADAIFKEMADLIPGADRVGSGIWKENFGDNGSDCVWEDSRNVKSDTEQIRSVSMIHSAVTENGEIVDLVMEYEIQMPFPDFGIKKHFDDCEKQTAHVDGKERIILLKRRRGEQGRRSDCICRKGKHALPLKPGVPLPFK